MKDETRLRVQVCQRKLISWHCPVHLNHFTNVTQGNSSQTLNLDSPKDLAPGRISRWL